LRAFFIDVDISESFEEHVKRLCGKAELNILDPCSVVKHQDVVVDAQQAAHAVHNAFVRMGHSLVPRQKTGGQQSTAPPP
jgi:hypothetical protein